MIQPKNLLIVRSDRIGDVVLSLPLARILKKHFPNCRVTYLVREYTKCIVQSNPYIDDIIVLREDQNKILLKENVKEISKHKFDSTIIVYPTLITALMIFLSRIKYRIGTGYRWYSFLFNHKIYEHRKFAEKHELEFNINLLTVFGINEKVSYENVQFNLKPDEESKSRILRAFDENKISHDKPIIIIHPGSGGSSVDWPISKFQELVRLLAANIDASILITGSESEKEMCEKLRISESIKNFAGMFSLDEFISLVDESDIFISNSTGPIHLAAALGKFTIGFYPNILSCSQQRWGPYTNKKIIFTPQIECSNCTREQCAKLDCMNSIKPENVFNEIKEIYQSIINHGELDA